MNKYLSVCMMLFAIILFVLACVAFAPDGASAETLYIGSIEGCYQDDVFGILPQDLDISVDTSGNMIFCIGSSEISLNKGPRQDLLDGLNKVEGWADLVHKNKIRSTKILFDNRRIDPDNAMMVAFCSIDNHAYIAISISKVTEDINALFIKDSHVNRLIDIIKSSEDKHSELLESMKNADLLK